MKRKNDLTVIDINAVQSRLLTVRDQQVLLDRDVAALYGVETRAVNQAVRNNPDKFPEGYVLSLDADEIETLRSKILTLEGQPGKGHHSKHGYKVFSERGLYMLATILKGARAVRATLSMIETYAQVRELKRELVDGVVARAQLLHRQAQAHGTEGPSGRGRAAVVKSCSCRMEDRKWYNTSVMTRDIQNRSRNSRTYRNMCTSPLLVQSTYTRGSVPLNNNAYA